MFVFYMSPQMILRIEDSRTNITVDTSFLEDSMRLSHVALEPDLAAKSLAANVARFVGMRVPDVHSQVNACSKASRAMLALKWRVSFVHRLDMFIQTGDFQESFPAIGTLARFFPLFLCFLFARHYFSPHFMNNLLMSPQAFTVSGKEVTLVTLQNPDLVPVQIWRNFAVLHTIMLDVVF